MFGVVCDCSSCDADETEEEIEGVPKRGTGGEDLVLVLELPPEPERVGGFEIERALPSEFLESESGD